MPRVRRSPFDAIHRAVHPALQHEIAERLNEKLQTISNEEEPFFWLKTGQEYPSYDDLAFCFRGNVFSIKIYECAANGESPLTVEEIEQLQLFAQENNLIPCGYPIDQQTHEPLESGWNLLSLNTGEPVNPAGLPAAPTTTLSPWERLSCQTKLAAQWLLQNRRGEIQNLCTIPGAVPQIFFLDGAGNRCWAIVQENDTPPDLNALLKEHPALRDADGFLGVVKLTPPVGEPATRMLHGNFTAEFNGLKRIYLAPSSSLTSSEDDEELMGQFPPEMPAEQLEEEVSGKGCLLFLVGALTALLAACACLS